MMGSDPLGYTVAVFLIGLLSGFIIAGWSMGGTLKKNGGG